MNTMLELRKLVVPEIIHGKNASLLVGRYISNFNVKKPMIVTDEQVHKQPWFGKIINEIAQVCKNYIIFDELTSNPKDFEAMKGQQIFIDEKCDFIIAIGGGSPIDCAKGVAIVSCNGGHILDYEGVDMIDFPGPPLICIPSTSGTGADVSQFAIITDTNMNIKKTIISKKAVPDLALVDPKPLMTMDLMLTAYTGMDALTHAIEAYVSNAHSDLTDIHALQAINNITDHIIDVCKPNRTINDLYYMMMGSLTAGIAFSNASLGLVHAMSHSLAGLFDKPHGMCNSILLQHVIFLNYTSASERYDCILSAISDRIPKEGATSQEKLVNTIDYIRQILNVSDNIEVHNLNNEILDTIVNGALSDPCIITNPKSVTAEEVRNIYEKILCSQK
jgi:alcohol dehydrogenase class IV